MVKQRCKRRVKLQAVVALGRQKRMGRRLWREPGGRPRPRYLGLIEEGV